MMQFLRHTPTQ